MLILWGQSSEEKVLGTVAEICPHCEHVGPCLLIGKMKGVHVYFVTLAQEIIGASTTCGRCHRSFPCEHWRYAAILLPEEAATLTNEVLIARTNPSLRDRLAQSQFIDRFAGDEEFHLALDSIRVLRPFGLRKRLWREFLNWEQLTTHQRADLSREAEAFAKALGFAESIAARVPANAGCLVALGVCLTVWSVLFSAPPVRHSAFAVFGVGVTGLLLGAVTQQYLFNRKLKSWIDEILIPEGKKRGANFQRVLEVISDLPIPESRSEDPLRYFREKLDMIREHVEAAGLCKTRNPGPADLDQF